MDNVLSLQVVAQDPESTDSENTSQDKAGCSNKSWICSITVAGPNIAIIL